MIKPHGGPLVSKVLSPEESQELLEAAKDLETLRLGVEQVKDVKNIAHGVYSPLQGFLREDDFLRVVSEMRLADGAVWPIPIVLDLPQEDYQGIKGETEIALADSRGNITALLKDIQIYRYDKGSFAENVFGTQDKNNPGVEDVYQMGGYLVGGDVHLLDLKENLFPEYNRTPQETRKIFLGRGWERVVAFQTRNVPHCAHEFLQKCALRSVDGLFVQPVIGEKKLEDFKDEYIISGYEILIDRYYPRNKVVLGILPLKMRYAGPREAVFHALIRKNFGCSHFIVGRDHAGVGNYYAPFAAQEIFGHFDEGEIGIEILKFPEVVFDKSKGKHCFIDECPEENRITFSGTGVREYVKNKKAPPSYIMRPEVYRLLANSYNSLVDSMYKDTSYNSGSGFVLWFTGFPQSGKSTIADAVCETLRARKVRVERLDGDVVRESLTKDLGFTKEDRDENIRRVGFIAKLLSRNGVGVVASFISPYKEQRDGVRMKVENFVEIFVNTPLEVCEKRDKKGLFAKARKGEIKNFTGISAPYEEPENPDIELRPDRESADECAKRVVDFLRKKGLVS